MENPRVACWIRVSTKEQPIARQYYDIREYFKFKGWEWKDKDIQEARREQDFNKRKEKLKLFGIYESKESAFITKKRKDFQLLLEECKTKKYNTLCFWNYDRYSRQSIPDTFAVITQFKQLGVILYSATEEYINNAPEEFKDMLIAMRSWIAWQESMNTSKRVKSGMNTINKEDLRPQGSVSFGYKYVGIKKTKNRTFGIKEDEAQVVKTIYTQFISGKTIKDISDELGLNYLKIRRILENKVYIGFIKFRGEWTKGNFEGIISEEDFYKVQELLKDGK